MTAPRPGLRECFDALVGLPAAERAAWLAAHDVDAALREPLSKLLAADGLDAAAVPVLRAGAAALAAEFAPPFDDDADDVADDGAGLVGTSVGPYRLTGVLGQGGTSVVFRAERPMGEGTQTVALKLLRTGLFPADSQRRFRREQGVLSQLSHPNIAALVDGGIGAGGTPYIAMEFVDGLPITGYADANALDLPARLRLLATVCRAVDSAHRALVVHRDLKPSNVLVSRDGVVKVLDFGIAQLLDDDGATLAQTQAIALTPGYAAPEQYRPGPVTTASDVYALGVLLGELLTGQRVARATFTGLSRAVDGTREPPHGLPAVPVLRRSLRGDLDAIHGTACAHAPGRRYGSAALLADDLERYLQKLPIAARAPSIAYRLRKYVQRNRIGAGAAALSLAAIVAGVSATLWQARVAHQESQRATAVSNFLVGLFEASRPGQLPERRLTLEQLVQRASERLQQESDLSPAARVDMLAMLGEASMAASDFPQANQLLDRALSLSRATYAPAHPMLLRIRLLRAHLLIQETRYADAATAYEEILPQIDKASDAPGIRGLQNYALALMYSARAAQALEISARAMRGADAFYGSGAQGAVLASLEHGDLLLGAGRAAAAAAVIEPALQRWREAAWSPTREYLRGLTNLARVRLVDGASSAAEPLARENLATSELIYQPPHEQIGLALLNLGDLLLQQERLDEAQPLLSRALAMFRAVYGDGQMRDANTLRRIGLLQLRRRALDAAAQSIAQAQQWCARPGLHATRTCLELDATETQVALARNDRRGAEASSARGLAMAREIYRDGSSSTADLLQLRAAVQLGDGDEAAALASCDEAQALLSDLDETRGPIAIGVAARRAQVLEALRRYAEAKADIEQALALWQRLAPDGYRRRVEMLALLAKLQSASGDAHAATATAKSALAQLRQRAEIDPARLALLQSLAGAARRGTN